jgi:hypothetical protein
MSFYSGNYENDAERKKAWSEYVAASRARNAAKYKEYNLIYVSKKSYEKFTREIDRVYDLLENETDETERNKLNKKLVIKQRYFYKCYKRLKDLDSLPGSFDSKYKGNFHDVLKLPNYMPVTEDYQQFLNY